MHAIKADHPRDIHAREQSLKVCAILVGGSGIFRVIALQYLSVSVRAYHTHRLIGCDFHYYLYVNDVVRHTFLT